MNLSGLEQHVFAYYVANAAEQLNMVPRYWPYGELKLLVEDKVQVAMRKFGLKAKMASPNVARVLLDLLIERDAFSTVKNEHGGTMHQYQSANYRSCVRDLQETDPVILKAKAAGPGYWDEAFAALTSGNPLPS
jgi:hypothetical protein